MTKNKKLISILLGSLLFSIITLGFCYSPLGNVCASRTGEGVALLIIFLSTAIFVFSLILLTLQEEVLRSWLRFVKYFIPIAFLIIIFSPRGGGGFGPGFGGFPDKETMTYWLTTLFSLVSIILIAVKSWRLRKSSNLTS